MTPEAVLSRIDHTLPVVPPRLADPLNNPSIPTDPASECDCDSAADRLAADMAGFCTARQSMPGVRLA